MILGHSSPLGTSVAPGLIRESGARRSLDGGTSSTSIGAIVVDEAGKRDILPQKFFCLFLLGVAVTWTP